MCSGASFTIEKDTLDVSQYGGYYGSNLYLHEVSNKKQGPPKEVLAVKQDMDIKEIQSKIDSVCSKKMLVEILAGIVKFSDE